MSKLRPEELDARDHFTKWFCYFREIFYAREGKPDIRMSEDLDVSRSYISDVMADKRTVGFDVALRMRNFFKRSLDELAFKLPEGVELDQPESPRSKNKR